jgi:hypothetical protein
LLYLTLALGAPMAKVGLLVPLAAEVAMGWGGARWLRRKLGRPSTSDQRARTALWNTVAGGASTVAGVLLASAVPSMAGQAGFQHLLQAVSLFAHRGALLVVPVSLVSVLVIALLRYLLLTLFTLRR